VGCSRSRRSQALASVFTSAADKHPATFRSEMSAVKFTAFASDTQDERQSAPELEGKHMGVRGDKVTELLLPQSLHHILELI